MKDLLCCSLVLLLLTSCAPTRTYLIGRTDFNPVYEWNPEIKVFVLPYDSTWTDQNYWIEAKLARLTQLAGKKAGLSFVDDPTDAEAFMFVKYQLDTVSSLTPATSYTYGGSTIGWNRLTRSINSNSYDWTITTPSVQSEMRWLRIELWLSEKPLSEHVKSNESPIRMVSYASERWDSQDHNGLTYDLLIACIKSIPRTHRYFDDDVPKVAAVLEHNWLSGILTRGKDQVSGNYSLPPTPFDWDDIIYEINGVRIYDYFDYKALMYSLPEKSQSCKLKVNRRGEQIEFEYRF